MKGGYDEIRVKESFFLRVKRFFFVKLKDKTFLKGIGSVIGACLLSFITGAIYSVCQISIYQISYIHNNNSESKVTPDNDVFYYPIEKFVETISTFCSAILYKILGLHYTNLIGIISLFISYLILLLSKSFSADMVSIVFGGIGTGIINYPSTANACEWFTDNNGIIIGLIETSLSLGSFFFNLIGEKIINPDNSEPTIKDGNYSYYTPEISQKFKTFMIYLIIIFIVIYISSFFLTFKKTEDVFKDTKNIKVGLLLEENNNNNNEYIENDSQNQKPFDEKQLELISNNVEPEKEKKDFKKMLFAAIKSKALLIFTLIIVVEGPLSSMIFALYRTIGEEKKINQLFLNTIGPINFIFECVGNFIFGILCDYVSKKHLLIFVNGIDTIIAFFYCLTFKSNVMFFIFTNMASFISGGVYSIKDYYLIKVFGVDLYIELIGYVNFFASIVVIALTPLSYHLQNKDKDENASYWLLFCIFGVLNLIGLALSFLTTEEPLDYDKLLKDNEEEKIKAGEPTTTEL